MEDGQARTTGGIAMKTWWVTLRYKSTGHEVTYHEKSALNRATLIIVTQQYADVVAQGEVDVHVR